MLEGNRILMIEDDESLRGAVRAIIGVYNEVTEAGSISLAHSALHSKEKFDVILIDKGLPDGDGATLLPEIQKIMPEATIIFLTGDSDFHSVQKCIEMGADDYVLKTENAIPDLLVRIPIAKKNARLRKMLAETKKSLVLSLPENTRELSIDHYKNFLKEAKKNYFKRAIELSDDDAVSAGDRIGLARSTTFKALKEVGLR